MKKGIFKKLNSKSGFSMAEIIISIMLMVVIVVGSARIHSGVKQKAARAKVLETVDLLSSTIPQWLIDNNSYSSVSVASAVTSEILLSAPNNTTWGGSYTIAVNAVDSNLFDITIADVPSSSGTVLATAMGGTYDSATETLVVTRG